MPSFWTLIRINPQSQSRYLAHVHSHYPTIETYVPLYDRLTRPHGRRRPEKVPTPCYPGYIFVRPNAESDDYIKLVRTPIRAYYIRFGKYIEPIPDRVILEIQRLESLQLLIPQDQDSGWKAGQRVRVSTPTLEIRAIIIRLIAHDQMLVDTPFCQMVVPVKSILEA